MKGLNFLRDSSRWACRTVLALALVSGLGALGGAWLLAYLMLHPPTLSTGETPSVPFEEVSFETGDGLVLWGWYLSGRATATVILVHGFARDRSELLPEAGWLVAQGYNVLLFDTRAQGSSEGAHISLGFLEALDVSAAVGFAIGRSWQERVAVMGYSMGAVAAIQAAANDTRIQAVIAISPFATLRETINLRLGRLRLLAPLVIWWGERMTNLRVDDLRPEDVIAAISPRPVLIMQAGGDAVIPTDSGQRLYQAATDPKELWLVPDIAHVEFREVLPEAYRKRIIDFLERHLPISGRRSNHEMW